MGTINKLSKLVLSFLLAITCINFSIVYAEDGEEVNYTEPSTVETVEDEPVSEPEQEVIPEEPAATEEIIVEKPVAEDPVVEKAAPVEEEKQEETVEPEVQQEAPIEPEIEKVETVEEVKVTVVVSYVDENDHPLTDPITGSYPTEYRLDENVDAFKSFDGYAFEKVIVNDDAKNTISKDDVQKNGLRITKDMTSLKLVYQKMNLESNENKEVIPEVTEEASEEAEPESNTNETELSAFDQTAFAGNVTVHVTAAEGVLPSGAQLIVKRVTRKAILNAVEETVTEKDKEVDSAIALDITIVNADGIEIQPNGIVNVSFENVAVGGEEVNVYHVTDDASTVTEVATNTQSFDANHFSIYVITGENNVKLTTFNFVAEGKKVSTQIVKTGDTLITPTAPDIAGKAFVEWQENGTKFDGFGVQTITKTEPRTITAKYEDALYVYFYNPEGTQIMRTEKVADHKGHDYSIVSYDVDATHKLVGWAAEVNGTTDITKNITVPEGSTSVNVYAIIKEGYWVTFDSDGGSAIDSQFVFDKISLNDQTTPTKPGYTFDGWYDGTTKVENGAAFSSPMTLKAHWKATEVSYTVNYWQQKVTDDKNVTDAQKTYEYVSAETKKATTGTKISASNTKSYNGFTYNANNSSKDVEIAGDGTTIINVYYDRVLCTVNFYEVTSRGLTKVKTATGLYEASLPKDTWDTSTYAWYSSYDYGYVWGYSVAGSGCILLTSFDFKTAGYENNTDNKKSYGVVTECNFYGTKARREYEVRYYNQQADGSYQLVQTVNTSGGTLTVHEKFIGYDLYKLVKGNVNGESSGYWDRNGSSVKDGDMYEYGKSGIINIASNLKSYSLSYYNYNKVTKIVSNIKYTSSMNAYENYTPERPSELPSYYVFGGWYKDKACTTKFDFSKETMPNANLQIYAKWSAEQISLTYNLKNPEGTVAKDTKKVEAGTVANTVLPSIPTINEYSFAGWYYADGNGNITSEVFNTNNTITRNISIVGKWLYKGELTVVYDPGTEESKATVPTDGKVYAGGAKVTVAKNATTTSDKKFLGWELNGNVYKPGQSFEVNKDIANENNQIILTATWGNAETSTTLTYDPGNGIGTAKRVDVMNNEAVEIKAHDSLFLGFSAPVVEGKEYYFAGWADSKTGNATYADGQTINIDANGENVLYAVWVEKTEITVTKPADSQYDGKEHKWSPTVADKEGNALVEGTDYEVAYSTEDFTNVTGTITVTITGIGNYTGTVTRTYEITPAEVTVTANNANKVYGEKDPELKATVTGTLNNDTVDYTVTRDPGEDVGKYAIHVTGDEDQGNYHVTYTAGEFEITKSGELILTAELTGESATKVYDGNPLTGGATANVKEGTTITYSTDSGATWTTEVPSITNVGTLKITARAENPNYEPAETTYSLTVTHATVTVTAENKTKVYGTADPELTATVTGLVEKDEGKVTIDYTTDRDGGEDVGKYTITPKGEMTQGNYIVEYATGTFEITPRSIKPDTPDTPEEEKTGIKVNNASDSIYNGQEHKFIPEITDKDDNKLVDGKDYEVSYSKDDFTNVTGEIVVTIKGKGNYTGEFTDRYQITKRYVRLSSKDDDKEYDGTPLTNTVLQQDSELTFVEGEASAEVSGTITNKGSVPNTITVVKTEKYKEDNYDFDIDEGTLTITAKEVTVTANNANKVYGEKDPELKATVTGTLNNDTVDYTVTRDPGEDVGKYAIHVTGDEDQGNYHVTYTAGEFEITKSGELILTAELTGESATKVYDGNPLTGGATANVKEGTTITYSTDSGATWTTEVPSITNVGTLKITARAENPNYEPAETTYSLTVTHATVTVTAENKTKVYGTADPELTATVSGTLGNDTVAYTLAREAGENAGKYKITVTGEENQGNYKVTYTPGTFEITPKTIVPDGPETPEEKKTGIEVTEPEDSKYDGKEHKNTPTVADTKTGKTLTEGTDYTLTYSEDVTNAGKVTVTVTGIGNYTGEFDVTYEITKRDVVLTSATDSKPYDGTALRNENVEVTGDGFAEGEGATFAVIGTITNVGTKANTFGYALNENTLASNYNISTELGTLTITPKSIIPDGPKTPEDKKTGITVENPGDVKYDGKDHAEKPVIKDEKTGVTLEEGKDYEIVYPEDIKNAGEITATVVGKGDYEGSFEIKYNITKRDVTFTSATDSKQYDGNALTNGNVEITGDGFIEGEGAEYKVTGTQTQVGNSANEFEYTLNENTLASNYDITKVVGTLTVTAAPAPETPEKPKPEVKKSVDTSDDNNIVFYGNAFFMAMITLAGIIVLRKKSS